ncbi:hypothetical protein [Streptomyces sp. NPDC006463]|uniref:hypothetical protein n=1 Tax=Streptomyces sp. NPDC006463 TaxID=3364746 RepID=UPI00368C54C2
MCGAPARPGEEALAVWTVKSSWFKPPNSLAITTAGLRITEAGSQLFVPYEDFGLYRFSPLTVRGDRHS